MPQCKHSAAIHPPSASPKKLPQRLAESHKKSINSNIYISLDLSEILPYGLLLYRILTP
jgi:hypothetical protein